MRNLEASTLSRIVKNKNLRLRNEDQLLNFLNGLYQTDVENSSLFDNVIFTNVTSAGMKSFVETVKLKNLNESTWKMLSSRLCVDINVEENSCNTVRYMKRSFSHKEGQELNGIIHYLTNKTGQNIHDNGTIEVTSNYITSDGPPHNILDFDKDNYYCSGGTRDAWICFDFKNQRIEISSYTIKSARMDGHAKNWLIEVSNDGRKWTTIDEKSNYSELNSNNKIKTFEVQRKQFCRFCKFRQTGDYRIHWPILDLAVLNFMVFSKSPKNINLI